MADKGPVIETARLRLRPHRIDDLQSRMAMTGNPHVMRYFGGAEALQNEEENWSRLLRYAGHWALLGHGLFAIEEKASGRFAGEIGLADFRRGLGSDFDPFPEAAWIVDQWAEGKGYATEAIRGASAWYDESFAPGRKVCIIAPDNLPSLRVAAKLGFTRFSTGEYHGRPIILLESLPLPKAADTR
jgi:RimJ/RimL family protein N-acetyltransferase